MRKKKILVCASVLGIFQPVCSFPVCENMDVARYLAHHLQEKYIAHQVVCNKNKVVYNPCQQIMPSLGHECQS